MSVTRPPPQFLFDNLANVENSSPDRLACLLGGTCFPRLRSLHLLAVHGPDTQLLALLRGSPDLQHLTIKWMWLLDGDWADLVERIKNLVKLKSVDISSWQYDWSSSEFVEAEIERMWKESLFVWRSAVTEYFIGAGPNPFLEIPSGLPPYRYLVM